MTKTTDPKPCPGCERSRKECWSDPCVHLRLLKAGPASKLGAWVREGGGNLVIAPETFHLTCGLRQALTGDERFERWNRSRSAEHQTDN